MAPTMDAWGQFQGVQLPDKKTIPKPLKSYYSEVREEMERMEKLYKDGETAQARAAREAHDRVIAVRCVVITFIVCLIFVTGKSLAAVFSNSVALFTSLVDNVMELVCAIIMWVANIIMKKKMPYRFPHGQARLEPLGILMFAMIMMMTGVMMIEKALDDILEDLNGHDPLHPNLDPVAIAVLVTTVVVKITMFFVMRRIPNPTVQALAMDHRNDTLANLVALAAGLLGTHTWPYLDPIGGILIALYIIIIWVHEGYVNILKASGRAAPPVIQRLITWAAITHPGNYVRGVTFLKTCSTGNRYNTEIEVLACPAPIVSPDELKLSIRQRVQMVAEVEHVFVGIDYVEDGLENMSTDLTDVDDLDLAKRKENGHLTQAVNMNGTAPVQYVANTEPAPVQYVANTEPAPVIFRVDSQAELIEANEDSDTNL